MKQEIEKNILKTTALVVLYDSMIMESTTLVSLLNTNRTSVKLKIIIWNNGPNILEENDINDFKYECESKNISFDIYQDIRNISLSHIYNFCINKNKISDFFTILDQDSMLEEDFITNLVLYSSYDVVCPAVCEKEAPKIQHYPHEYPNGDVFPAGEFDAKKIVTIGSGLSLSKNLLIKMSEIYTDVFDEDFVFYYTDIQFFHRLEAMSSVQGYCCGKMLHSESTRLSYLEMSETKKVEMGYMDIISRIKRKRNTIRLVYFCLRYSIKTKCSFLSLCKLIKCAVTKQHPRAIFRIASDFKPDYSN